MILSSNSGARSGFLGDILAGEGLEDTVIDGLGVPEFSVWVILNFEYSSVNLSTKSLSRFLRVIGFNGFPLLICSYISDISRQYT